MKEVWTDEQLVSDVASAREEIAYAKKSIEVNRFRLRTVRLEQINRKFQDDSETCSCDRAVCPRCHRLARELEQLEHELED